MSSPPSQATISQSNANLWLEENTAMSECGRLALSELATELITRVPLTTVSTLAIAGSPGSGKSTLSRLLTHLLNQSGRATVLLSLDDYYLSREERKMRSQKMHELFINRGVPGTHNWNKLLADFDHLRKGEISGLKLPVFDKSTDDLKPESRWSKVSQVPAIIILEGWCVGAQPQSPSELLHPCNLLEKQKDGNGQWRKQVNRYLTNYRDDLLDRIDQFWYLEVPDWDCVVNWRWQQEQELEQRRLQSRAEVIHFLGTFERIFRNMQSGAHEWADLRLYADHSHRLKIQTH
jgi:D-glycerate 3-kinase